MVREHKRMNIRPSNYRSWLRHCEYAKQFKSSMFDFIFNWYPGKQNSILLHGKDGELFKAVLLRVLKGDCQGWVDYKIFVVRYNSNIHIIYNNIIQKYVVSYNCCYF